MTVCSLVEVLITRLFIIIVVINCTAPSSLYSYTQIIHYYLVYAKEKGQ